VWSKKQRSSNLFANVDAGTCASQSTNAPADPGDAPLLANVTIGEAVWSRLQEADWVYARGHRSYCGTKNTEFFCLLNVTSQVGGWVGLGRV
jgi:hypothetical protein